MNIIKTALSYMIVIPKITDEGYLSYAEGEKSIPFNIKRVYYIYDVETNAVRGRHAHKKTRQVLFCVKGSIKLLLDNGYLRENILLKESNKGILIDRMIWHDMYEISHDAVLLILASEYYKPSDYIRDYREFLELSGTKLKNWLSPYRLFLKTIKGLL